MLPPLEPYTGEYDAPGFMFDGSGINLDGTITIQKIGQVSVGTIAVLTGCGTVIAAEVLQVTPLPGHRIEITLRPLGTLTHVAGFES